MHIGIAAPVSIDQLNSVLTHKRYDLPPGLGGIAVNNIITGLWQSGHTVSVFALEPSIDEPLLIRDERISIHVFPYRKRVRERALDFFRTERQYLLQSMIEEPVDIIHAHWTYEFAIAAIKSKKPYLITVHDSPIQVLKLMPNAYRFLHFLMALWVMKNGKAFSTVSPYMQRQLMPFISKPVPLVPNLLTDEWLANHNTRRNFSSKKIVSVMNGWGKIKNPENLLRAFSIVINEFPDATLTLFGNDFGMGEKGQLWAKQNNLAKGVIFKGYVPSAELRKVFPKFDLLVHTSLEESFGMTLIEAMASGVPVVAGERSGAVPWVLDFGKAGFLVDVKNPDKVSECIRKIFMNDNVAEKIDYGHELILHRYQSKQVIAQYVSLYEKVLSGGIQQP
jgi:glycosyltransferase involved in cell wall biosynthesis